MEQKIDNFNVILSSLDEALVEMAKKQCILRNVIKEKNWEALLEVTKEINRISAYFQDVDALRDEFQKNMSDRQLEPYLPRLREIRSKLLKCKVENNAIAEYVKVSKNFIQEVIEIAMPGVRNKNYSRNGSITQPQMQSVLVDLRR